MNNETTLSYYTVTEDKLKTMKNKYYGSGTELKVGDKIYFGFVMNSANINGTPVTSFDFDKDYVSMSMLTFVLDEASGILYQLYAKK